MGTVGMAFNIFAGQTKAGVFYSNRTEAFVELVGPSAIGVQVIEGSILKQGGSVPGFTMETCVANVRVPAGHWLVVTRENPEQGLELRVRRLVDPSNSLVAPIQIVTSVAFSVSGQQIAGIVRNGLNRPMTYRMVAQADSFVPNATCHIRSGSDDIHPLAGNFILDTVVPSEGTLELRAGEGTFTGHYDLYGDP